MSAYEVNLGYEYEDDDDALVQDAEYVDLMLGQPPPLPHEHEHEHLSIGGSRTIPGDDLRPSRRQSGHGGGNDDGGGNRVPEPYWQPPPPQPGPPPNYAPQRQPPPRSIGPPQIPLSPAPGRPPRNQQGSDGSEEGRIGDAFGPRRTAATAQAFQPLQLTAAATAAQRIIPRPPRPPPPRTRPFEQPLDPRFKTVDKPKRFFSVGRIFKTPWFEPSGISSTEATPASPPSASTTASTSGRRTVDVEYAEASLGFYGEKPYAKFRWFVVVRKRLHHSLCFSITTFGGRGATKTSRGRPKDFVVLYKAGGEPPKPQEEEEISREPLGLIIEDDEQEISKLARLDCGRLYTVEDNLKVMKIGRVHRDWLPTLEEYYKEAVM